MNVDETLANAERAYQRAAAAGSIKTQRAAPGLVRFDKSGPAPSPSPGASKTWTDHQRRVVAAYTKARDAFWFKRKDELWRAGMRLDAATNQAFTEAEARHPAPDFLNLGRKK